MGSDENEMCQNCKRDIPIVNYRMHTLHCARNVQLCPECDEPVPRSAMEEHRQEEHVGNECADCGQKVPKSEMEEHKSDSCSERVLICQFCKLDQKAGELPAHEGYCGSRTEKCDKCGDFVMLREWDKHEQMTLYHELAQRPCSQVFGYEPLTQIAPNSSLITRPTTASTPLTRKTSEPSFLSKYQSPAINGSSGIIKGGSGAGNGDSDRKFSLQHSKSVSNTYAAADATAKLISSFSLGTSDDKEEVSKNIVALKSSRHLPPYKTRTEESPLHRGPDWLKTSSFGSTSVIKEDEDQSRIGRRRRRTREDESSIVSSILGGGGARVRSKSSAAPRSKKTVKINDDPSMDVDIDADLEMYRPNFGKKSASSSALRGIKYPSPDLDKYHDKKNGDDSEVVEKMVDGWLKDSQETRIPCEFCEQSIPMLKLISHQATCTRNMDSLYFNAKAPLNQEKRVWPDVVTKALTSTDDHADDVDDVDIPVRPKVNNGQMLSAKNMLPSQLPEDKSVIAPKNKDQITGGARPKRSKMTSPPNTTNSSSIVGRYLGGSNVDISNSNSNIRKTSKKRRAPPPPPQPTPNDDIAVGKLISISPEPDNGITFGARRRVMPRKKEEEEEDESEMPWRKLLREGERRTREIMITERMVEEARMRQQQQQQQQQQQYRNGGFGFDYHNDDSSSVAMLPLPPKNRQLRMAAGPAAAAPAAPADDGTEEREKLREMLSGLRKDPFDDDLENNDGSFFPCEFCGDPYPVEFIMRHQLSCDLNPNPVTAGSGFDYAQIRSRAEANMALSKQADQIKF